MFATIADPPLAPTLEPLVSANGGGGDGESIRAAMERIASMGFRFVQLSATQPGLRPRDLDQSARRDLVATLRRRELAVAGLDLWIPPRHFLEAAHSDRAVSAVLAAIELASDLGRGSVSLTLPGTTADDSDALKPALDAISDHANRFGVMIADHAVPVVARDSELIGVGIDPAAWLSSGGDPSAALMANARRIVSARVCDLLTSGLRGPVGDRHEGQLDVVAYKVALSVIGYARPAVVDARNWIEPWKGIEQTRRAWNAGE